MLSYLTLARPLISGFPGLEGNSLISYDIFKYLLSLIVLYSCLNRGDCDIVITRHAFERALQRGIHPALVEATLQCGKMVCFGKNSVKFEKRFRQFTVVCVDEKEGSTIRIVTIEKR